MRWGGRSLARGISDMRFACPRTTVNSTRTGPPIVTGEETFELRDSPEGLMVHGFHLDQAARGTCRAVKA